MKNYRSIRVLGGSYFPPLHFSNSSYTALFSEPQIDENIKFCDYELRYYRSSARDTLVHKFGKYVKILRTGFVRSGYSKVENTGVIHSNIDILRLAIVKCDNLSFYCLEDLLEKFKPGYRIMFTLSDTEFFEVFD